MNLSDFYNMGNNIDGNQYVVCRSLMITNSLR